MKGFNTAATSIVVLLAAITLTAFSIIKIEGQPLGVYLRMVGLALLGESTPGMRPPTEPPRAMYCDQQTGACEYR